MAGDDAREPRDGDAPGSPERIEELAADPRRRAALRCLQARPNPVSLPDVADYVTRREYGLPPESVPDERLHVYMSLYHDHVPALEAADLVTYSQEADEVELTDRGAERVGPIVRRDGSRDL